MRLLGIWALAALSACGSPSPPPAPDGSAAIEASVSELAISRAGEQALSAGRAGHPYRELTVSLAGTDRYGAEASLRGFTLVWGQDDLNRVRWDSIDKYALIDLASLRGGGVDSVHGAISLRDWCSDNGQMLTPRLCALPRTIAN